ncbi:serine/threonine-protein kinase [Nonomuraea sp. N2-4H]|uniref:serine/threonine-protein kinase n=1 Tax=unclassified Nonomuraea TaxID=2593643 RepID=UPI00325086A7
MADFTPLLPGDPQQLGGYELLGRLGEGGQGVVYLAKTPMDVRVAIKWLRPSDDEDSVARFLREAEVARRVAAFCTAAVLSTGKEHGRPYIVSEYVEGRSLDRVVRENGPLAGGDLERLAIGTATALAAIHEAGVVHRDFKPGNVIMSASGPRVIDFGIARTLDPATMTSSTQIGTPAYMAPEQILGQGVGPAADMFSWAGAMVFASCGRAPFGSDGTHAVMSRVLNEDPQLGALEGKLADLARRCLSKDPADRPTAMEVITQLLRSPKPGVNPLAEGTKQAEPAAGTPAGSVAGPTAPPPPGAAGAPAGGPIAAVPSGPRTPPTGPSGRQRRKVMIIASTLVAAAAVTAAITVPTLLGRDNSPPASAAPATTTPAPTAPDATSPTPSNSSTPTPAATPTRRKLPGGDITLHESPSDPITLTRYVVGDTEYARQSLNGEFTKYSDDLEAALSPDGRYLATRPEDYTSDGYDSILITDRRDGSSFRVKTVRDPLIAEIRHWTKDGSKVLLNTSQRVGSGDDKEWYTIGFVIIDVATAKANIVRVNDEEIRGSDFAWDAEDKGVVIEYGEGRGLRFFDASGEHVRDVPGVGPVASGTMDIFSPSGRLFTTACPNGKDGETCVWDSATSQRVYRFTSDCDKVLGWWDEQHLYCWENDNTSRDEVRVVSFDGKLMRRLLDKGDKVDFGPYYTIDPVTS